MNYVMLSDAEGSFNGVEKWRISALRIMLITGFIFYFAVAVHSCISAVNIDFAEVIVLNLFFYLFGGVQLWFSRSHYTFSAYSLLIMIVVAALSINIIAQDPALALFGPVFVFSLPLAAFILLGAKVGFVCMLLNLLPFTALLSGFQLNQYFPVHSTFEYANVYIISIIFLFFNVCAPLSVARSSLAARRFNQQLSTANVDLQKQKDFYKTLFVESEVAKLAVYRDGLIKEINLSAQQLLNYHAANTSEPIYLSDLFDDVPDDAGEKVVNRTIGNKLKVFKLTRSRLFSQEYFFLTVQDITAKVMLHKTLAAHSLITRQHKLYLETGLPNRLWLTEKLTQMISHDSRDLCLIAIKITNAQFIEQKYGFKVLPLLVKALSKYWQASPAMKSHMASLDNINLTLVGKIPLKDVRVVVQGFLNHIPKAIELDNQAIPVSLQAGISFADSKTTNAESLINNALYAVNSASSQINFYETSSLERFIEDQEISILLNEAISSNELDVVYQPKTEANGNVVGLEALLRWESAVIGLVSPAIFIPIAEKSGLLPKITQWLISRVCLQISDWEKQGGRLVPVALNISGIDLDQDDFEQYLINSLLKHRINPRFIELELTESAISRSVDKALNITRTLSEWGFTIVLDDFGKGYSGLSKLLSYPVKGVKIDRQFIKDIHLNERKSKVVEAMIAMCQVLDIDILAEGTEKMEEVAALQTLGCEVFQGFVFSKPLTPENVLPILKQNQFVMAGEKDVESDRQASRM